MCNVDTNHRYHPQRADFIELHMCADIGGLGEEAHSEIHHCHHQLNWGWRGGAHLRACDEMGIKSESKAPLGANVADINALSWKGAVHRLQR